MRRLFSAIGVLALLLLPTHLSWLVEVGPRVAAKPGLVVHRGTIARHSTLGSVLAGALPPSAIQDLVDAGRPLYDLARISVGHPFGLALGPDGLVAAFTYGIDELRTLRIRREATGLKAELVTRSYETRKVQVSGTITSSLFTAVTAAGEEDQLALDLADIFAWDVDFHSEIQRGDSFRLAVEKLYVEGRFSRYGRILSAEFVRGRRVLRAVRFAGETSEGYYSPDGTPLRKAFLRSPLKFTRITSGFTYARFHPILKEVTTHLGIDYAAPVGTPVLAASDGVVTVAGWSDNGFGNSIHLRHANGFETLYGHLSRVDVRPGQRVSQGAAIGAVGSTGLSTGPHLDYRMMRSGVFVNPLTIQSPPAEPIAAGERAAFDEVSRDALALLEGRLSPASRAVASNPTSGTPRPTGR